MDHKETGMTARERVKAVMNFRKPDVLPWMETYSVGTVLRWLREGLPIDKVAVVEDTNLPFGLLFQGPAFAGFNLHPYFGSVAVEGLILIIDCGPIPKFNSRVLNRISGYVDSRNGTGQLVRKNIMVENPSYSMPLFLDFPVKGRQSWETYSQRLNPNSSARYPKDWQKDDYLLAFEEYQDGYTSLVMSGFYGFGAQLMGITRFVEMFYSNPELIRQMAEYWEYFTIETYRDAVEALKDRIDAVFWWEDLAERHGPNISPKLYREFLLPHYKVVTSFLKKNKIDRIMMDSDGNTNAILDLAVEAGITGHWPLEVNSGMDALSLREKYGTKLFLVGNLDKGKLGQGEDVVRQEIESKVPILKEKGGYIPGLDHDVPATVPLDKYREYVRVMKEYLTY